MARAMLVAAIALVGAPASGHGTEQLSPCDCVKNGDFNATTVLNSTTYIDGWTGWSPPGSPSCDFEVDASRSYAGLNSAVVRGGHGAWSTRLKCLPGADADEARILRVSFQYRTEGAAADIGCGRISASLTRGPQSAAGPWEANKTVWSQKLAILVSRHCTDQTHARAPRAFASPLSHHFRVLSPRAFLTAPRVARSVMASG